MRCMPGETELHLIFMDETHAGGSPSSIKTIWLFPILTNFLLAVELMFGFAGLEL